MAQTKSWEYRCPLTLLILMAAILVQSLNALIVTEERHDQPVSVTTVSSADMRPANFYDSLQLTGNDSAIDN